MKGTVPVTKEVFTVDEVKRKKPKMTFKVSPVSYQFCAAARTSLTNYSSVPLQ